MKRMRAFGTLTGSYEEQTIWREKENRNRLLLLDLETETAPRSAHPTVGKTFESDASLSNELGNKNVRELCAKSQWVL